MCFDDNARPPIEPTGTAHGADLVLTAEDGNRFAAYIARPEDATGAKILVFPDVRGLHQFYKELAMRFAEAGIAALAIDYFGRTAGLTSRDDSFDFWPHVEQMQMSTFLADVKAALAYVRMDTNPNPPIFTVGFCRGGSLSFLTGTEDLGLAGVIGFYAGTSRGVPGKGTILEQAEHIKYPALGLFGGADQSIPVSDVRKFEKGLEKAGVEHEIVIYPGTPHSFFDRRWVEFTNESADAWKRILGFIAAHTPQ